MEDQDEVKCHSIPLLSLSLSLSPLKIMATIFADETSSLISNQRKEAYLNKDQEKSRFVFSPSISLPFNLLAEIHQIIT